MKYDHSDMYTDQSICSIVVCIEISAVEADYSNT